MKIQILGFCAIESGWSDTKSKHQDIKINAVCIFKIQAIKWEFGAIKLEGKYLNNEILFFEGIVQLSVCVCENYSFCVECTRYSEKTDGYAM